MSTWKHLAMAGLYAFSYGVLFCDKALAMPETLGKPPVCEPSAAVMIACPEAHKTCLLVGDNENDTTLFRYPIQAKTLQSAEQQAIALGVEISDIEALAQLQAGQVLIMGSHSRNNKCEAKKKRRRFVLATMGRDSLQPRKPLVESPEISAKHLFAGVSLANNAKLAALSRAIDEAEAAARRAEGDKQACAKVNAFNAEGVLALARSPSTFDVWVGLRSPVLPFNATKYTVLLHMVSLDAYRFDGAAFLDLDGRGIRDLAQDAQWIWGIAGGPEDDQDNFVLWKIARTALKPNALLRPQIVRSLPASSEGLAILDGSAYVLIDGEQGDDDTQCKTPGKYISFPLP